MISPVEMITRIIRNFYDTHQKSIWPTDSATRNFDQERDKDDKNDADK